MKNNVQPGDEGMIADGQSDMPIPAQQAPAPAPMPQAAPAGQTGQTQQGGESVQSGETGQNGALSRDEGIKRLHMAQQKLYEDPNIFAKVATAMKSGEDRIEQPIAQAVFSLVDKVEQETGPIDFKTLQKIWFAMTVELYTMAKEADLLKEKVGKERLADALGRINGQYMKKYPDKVNRKAMGNVMQSPQAASLMNEMGAKPAPQREMNPNAGAQPAQAAAPAMPGAAGGLING